MRCLRKNAQSSPIRDSPRDPLAESISGIPLNRHKHRDWASLSDDKIVSYAKRFIQEYGISGWRALSNADPGLYFVLGERGLQDRVGMKMRLRYDSMDDRELVEYAKKFMAESGLNGRKEMRMTRYRLYDALRKRGLLDCAGFEEKNRNWAGKSDDQVLGHVKMLMKTKGLSSPYDFQKVDKALYSLLERRGLVGRAGFERKNRKWSGVPDSGILDIAKEFVKGRDITRKYDLRKADAALYSALWRRGLLGCVFPEIDKTPPKAASGKKRRERPVWYSLADAQLIQYARDFIKEKGISGKNELKKASQSLYLALRRRRLLANVGFEQKLRDYRDWSSMTDGQLIQHARALMKEKRITGKTQLKRADPGLHEALRKRKLLKEVGFEQKRRECHDWSSMTDMQLIEYARSFMKERGITGRGQLYKADQGLYTVLIRRKLLSASFEGIEQAEKQSLESELVSGLRQAADAMEEFGGERE